jgi:hypothetical protein
LILETANTVLDAGYTRCSMGQLQGHIGEVEIEGVQQAGGQLGGARRKWIGSRPGSAWVGKGRQLPEKAEEVGRNKRSLRRPHSRWIRIA